MSPPGTVSGLLYVTMQPQASCTAEEFHDWYNNEHGPTRLRLPFVQNGFRYRATDLGDGTPSKALPEWLAMYDISDMNELNGESYLQLRGPPFKSEREAATMKKIDIDRRVYDLVFDQVKPEWRGRLEDVMSEGKEQNVLVAASFRVKPGADGQELDRWYEEEHIPMLAKVPGWRRSRRYISSTVVKPLGGAAKPDDDVEYLALHEYAPTNGLGGPEFQAATSTPWRTKVMDDVVLSKARRVYTHAYTFGPAPRYLSTITSFTSPDGLTTTSPATPSTPHATITSHITTPDGVTLPYSLTGNPSPHAPVLVLTNSILTTYTIWDAFISHFLSQHPSYRILRYNSRGRSPLPPSSTKPITVDLLASDIITLLDALRVPTASLCGVSLGGATVLAAALNHPDRISAFVSCDTNASAPADNDKAWCERIDVAEKEGATAGSLGVQPAPDTRLSPADQVVGNELAELTVRRWFAPESYDGGELEAKCHAVKAAVASNSLEGFKESVKALWEYDYSDRMKASRVKGAFVVGERDGKLPARMRGMAERYGKDVGGAEGWEKRFLVVEGAGHLPMVERAEIVAEFVGRVLEG
ncbi:alpha/beta-hydrolase [Saccharata proteae CBS 121410]|uniref:Alpha/beta-hydrolase n=1 Tax=Saccharata proteae CBS 121410 TaxID=1314787 RepID=A0A9P4HUA7_9PEZI|nr:alpha/beta-hydrolase [Saccharata proteae CBS 121410]